MSDKIEINIDATSLGSASCIRKFFWTTIGSITDNQIDGGFRSLFGAAAMYGVAVHKFVDTMFKTGGYGFAANKDMLEAFHNPKLPAGERQQYLEDEKHLQTTAWNLWNDKITEESSYEVLSIPTKCYWCHGAGCEKCKMEGIKEGPASELTFRIKFYEDPFLRIFLCGTIDNLGKFNNGCYAIRDFKTTSSHKQDEFISNFEMSRQLRIYVLATKLMSRLEPDSILGRVGATNVGAFIDAIFIKPKANDNEYKRSNVFQYSQEEMTEFESQLQDFCEYLAAVVVDKLSFNGDLFYGLPKQGLLNGSCIAGWGKCHFWNVCKNPENIGKLLLERDFKRRQYNPLNFNEAE